MQWTAAALTTQNTATDGTGTVSTIFTSDATNGGFVQKLIVRALGSTTSATVLRVFVNNGSTNATVANNSLIAEITLPVIVSTNAAAQPDFVVPLNIALPAGYKLNCVVGTTVTGGWQVTAVGGKY